MGDPRLTVVDSVGLVGASAGGAVEWDGSPVLCLLQVRVLSDGGARWSLVVVRLLPRHPRIGGSVPCFVPRPGPPWRRIWDVKISKVADGVDLVDGDGVAGRRLHGAEWRRLPVRAGDPPDPRLWGGGAAARRRNVLVVVSGIGVQRDLVVISFFVLDCSVRTVV